LGNNCECPKRVSLPSKKSDEKGAINFSVSNEIIVEVNTQNEKQGANKTITHMKHRVVYYTVKVEER
jgi:hypothetical protein